MCQCNKFVWKDSGFVPRQMAYNNTVLPITTSAAASAINTVLAGDVAQHHQI